MHRVWQAEANRKEVRPGADTSWHCTFNFSSGALAIYLAFLPNESKILDFFAKTSELKRNSIWPYSKKRIFVPIPA
jgi:hypothetical protein